MRIDATTSFRNRTLSASLLVLGLTVMPSAGWASDCRADLDDNGAVDGSDLGLVLASWGGSSPDFNDDGTTACFELELVLGQWGPCPCPGDVNGDRRVGGKDLNLVIETWGNDCRIDLDENGLITENDVDALLCQFGTSDPTADFDGDGLVTASDLSFLLVSFGTDCRGDLDHDGVVGSGDLNIVLGAWGACSP